jgi:hypothetical protein
MTPEHKPSDLDLAPLDATMQPRRINKWGRECLSSYSSLST